jgi:putative flippase GtrA
MAGAIDTIRRYRRFLTFCAVGGSGVLVNMVVFAGVLRLWPSEARPGGSAGDLAVNVAALLGWAVSVWTNYALNDRLTFADQTADRSTGWWRRAGRYYISATAALVVQLAVLNTTLWLLHGSGLIAGIDPQAGSLGLLTLLARWAPECCNLVGIAAGTVANYLLAKGWVFK